MKVYYLLLFWVQVQILDVASIDPYTISLNYEGKSGPARIRSAYEDVATPFEGDLCDCHELGGDGYMDLTLKFNKKEILKDLNNLKAEELAGKTIPLTLTGLADEAHRGLVGNSLRFLWSADVRSLAQTGNHKKI